MPVQKSPETYWIHYVADIFPTNLEEHIPKWRESQLKNFHFFIAIAYKIL